MNSDTLDTIALSAFQGLLVRKDLVRAVQQVGNIPAYVAEHYLCRYCCSKKEDEIQAGLHEVKMRISEQYVSPGSVGQVLESLHSRGHAKLIDRIRIKPAPNGTGCIAELPSLGIRYVAIAESIVESHLQAILADRFVEIDLESAAESRQDKDSPGARIVGLREICLPQRDWAAVLIDGRAAFSMQEWKQFLLRSIGYEPAVMPERAWDIILLRLVPFVTANFYAVEIGPRGTGKTYAAFLSPHARVMRPLRIATEQIFTAAGTLSPGPLLTHDVVYFDDAAGLAFADKPAIAVMKAYMTSGSYEVGHDTVQSDASIVFHATTPNGEKSVRRDHELCESLPREVRHDVAFMDRLHSVIPGWEIPRITPEHMTGHLGLCATFLAACWHQLRVQSRVNNVLERIHLGSALSRRDQEAALKTIDGLLKLVSPGEQREVTDDVLEWATALAIESRLRIKEQQKQLMPAEFSETGFSYRIGKNGVEQHVRCL
jgi:ATP-dependent Lon protease